LTVDALTALQEPVKIIKCPEDINLVKEKFGIIPVREIHTEAEAVALKCKKPSMSPNNELLKDSVSSL